MKNQIQTLQGQYQLHIELKQDRVVNSSGSKMVNFHRTEAGLT